MLGRVAGVRVGGWDFEWQRRLWKVKSARCVDRGVIDPTVSPLLLTGVPAVARGPPHRLARWRIWGGREPGSGL